MPYLMLPRRGHISELSEEQMHVLCCLFFSLITAFYFVPFNFNFSLIPLIIMFSCTILVICN